MPKQNWIIRPANLSDAPGLQACMHAAYTPYTTQIPTEKLPPLNIDYEQEINENPTWVALSENEVVGGLTLTFTPEKTTLANISVHPNFQGNGLGKGLLKEAETQAKTKGYTELHLATHPLLTDTIALYTHLGWTTYAKDEKKVHFKKVLF